MELDLSQIKKNSNEFSFTKEAINEVNNEDFMSGASDFYKVLDGALDTQKSYLWTAMSAVTDEVGEALYEKILNYIDDIADIDTCEVKALQSMAQILGTDYSVFDALKNAPLEIVNLVSIFSMRRDYLVKSDKVSKYLANILSSTAAASNAAALSTAEQINESRSSALFDQVSAAPAIDAEKLDKLIYTAFYRTLTSNVFERYCSYEGELIYEELSDSILCSGFEIPNPYSDDIIALKSLYNIPPAFDTEDEADKIDAGLSTFNDYSQHELCVLELEYKHRNAAKYILQNRTRYSYYREAKVRQYFRFIEDNYNLLVSTYMKADKYEIDNDYLEIEELSSAESLLKKDSNGDLKINDNMLSTIAAQLLTVSTTIRGIREHLKSHAQRVYMKGTYLLLAYAVAEYLKMNVYPALETLGYDLSGCTLDTNKLQLIEYIDQTNYSNIQTDIEDDVGDASLNPQFWTGTGAAGNGDSLDTTNIFKPESKSKIISMKSFSNDQIADFYQNVLKCAPVNAADEYRTSTGALISFLSTVFEYGADNTWSDGSNIFYEMRNTAETSSAAEYLASRRFSKDVAMYLSKLASAYASASYVFDSYSSNGTMIIETQLSDAYQLFLSQSQQMYSDDLFSYSSNVDAALQLIQNAQQKIEAYSFQFENIVAEFDNLTAMYLQYTGEFEQPDVFIDAVNSYEQKALNVFDIDDSVKTSIVAATISIKNRYNMLLKEAYDDVCLSPLSSDIASTKFSFSYNPISLSIDIAWVTSYLSSVASKTEHESFINACTNALDLYESQLVSKQAQMQMDGSDAIQKYLDDGDYPEVRELSALLSGFYDEVFDIKDCVEEISKRLNDADTQWKEYKEKLFYKYTGLSTSDTPWYYLENSKHPSFQIHPCLENFIEKLDFSYPLKDLAGLAKSTIEYVAQNNANNRLCIDNDGYLLSVWNNPLNGNGDYLTKYEKSNHIDADGEDNCLFGYDGLFYPAAAASFNTVPKNNKWYKGLNISDLEFQHLYDKHDAYKYLFGQLTANEIDIIRYGLDVYENCYSLVRFNNEEKVLFFKPKNYPYSFPAIAYDNSGYLSSSAITYDESWSNSYFDNVAKVSISRYSYPYIEDFIFSKDRTTLLLLAKSGTTYVPIPVNISQKYVRNDNYDEYLRYFYKNRNTNVDHLLTAAMSTNLLTSFYVNKQQVGILYGQYSNNSIDISVDVYHNNKSLFEVPTTITGQINLPNLTGSPLIDVQNNGSFQIAYVADQTIITNAKSYAKQTFNYRSLTSYLDIQDRYIEVVDCDVYDTSIREVQRRKYAMFSDMGAIPIVSSNNADISETTLVNDLDNGKPLVFEIFGPSANSNAGIDFKFLTPIRMYEGYDLTATDSGYHRDGTSAVEIYSLDQYVHYFESDKNKYVLQTNDFLLWEMTESERQTYLSAFDNDKNRFYDYLHLANYDVQHHISALRNENATDSQYAFTDDEISLITRPYLISYDKLTCNAISPYLNGIYNGNRQSAIKNATRYVINLNGTDKLSASWINDNGRIKLDFNSAYYVNGNITDNLRNRYHLFLNLDCPGESGYLLLYDNPNPTNTIRSVKYKLFIKNISDNKTPRFVIKSMPLSKEQSNDPVHAFSASSELLATEGFGTSYVSFT